MKRTVLLLGGFSGRSPAEQFVKVIPKIEEAGFEPKIIDYLWSAREERFFPLIGRDAKNAAKEAEKHMKAVVRKKNIVITYSYGIFPAVYMIDSLKLTPEKMIVIVPPFGTNTIRWKWYEKILLAFPFWFPGFAELREEDFWEEIFKKLKSIKKWGTKITFFIPPENRIGYGLHADGRVFYLNAEIEKMRELGEIEVLPIGGHRDAIKGDSNIDLINQILKR